MKTVKMKDGIKRIKDQSDMVKTYTFDGSTYTLTGINRVSVPDIVADSWVAHDTDVEIDTSINR